MDTAGGGDHEGKGEPRGVGDQTLERGTKAEEGRGRPQLDSL